jgi:hypothetical protein
MKQQYIGFFGSGTLCPNAASQAPVAMPNYRTRNLQLVKQVNAANHEIAVSQAKIAELEKRYTCQHW